MNETTNELEYMNFLADNKVVFNIFYNTYPSCIEGLPQDFEGKIYVKSLFGKDSLIFVEFKNLGVKVLSMNDTCMIEEDSFKSLQEAIEETSNWA